MKSRRYGPLKIRQGGTDTKPATFGGKEFFEGVDKNRFWGQLLTYVAMHNAK